jgi:hypothetical protein
MSTLAVRAVRNQYHGVNAHLHSLWQGTGKWNRFHNYFISKLMEDLKARLLPMGYTVEIEEALQVRRVGDDLPRRPRPDLLVVDTLPVRGDPQMISALRGQPLLLETLEAEDYDHPYTALAIYELLPDFSEGEAVAWVELLSPSNKGSSRDAYTYLAKRRLLLEHGLVLLEIDLLHETSPTFERLADYAAGEPGAAPYRLMVVDPRPDYREAKVLLHEVAVDMPLPVVDVPLNGDDMVSVDFEALYRRAFEDGLYGYGVDYRELPINFERYSETDQTRIVNRMLTVMQAAHDLDTITAPLAATTLPLHDALAQIALLNSDSEAKGNT